MTLDSMTAITKDLIGTPFEKMGCLPLIKAVYDRRGISIPTEYDTIWEGANIDNYMDFFKKDAEYGMEGLLEFCKLLGEPVAQKQMKPFDFLIISQERKAYYPAIYIGKQLAIASFIKTGVTAFNLGTLCTPILIRRLG